MGADFLSAGARHELRGARGLAGVERVAAAVTLEGEARFVDRGGVAVAL